MVAVKYKYQNEAEVIIDKADNYTIETSLNVPIGWQAVGEYFDVHNNGKRMFLSAEVTSNNGGVIEELQKDLSGTTRGASWLLQLNGGLKRSLYATDRPVMTSQSSAQIGTLLPIGTDQTLRHWAQNRNEFGVYIPGAITYYHLNPVLLFWWVCRRTSKYNLKIYKGNTQVFSRTEVYQPQYVQVVGGCPSNTCPVLCGNGVCCYNDKGIAVSSYEY